MPAKSAQHARLLRELRPVLATYDRSNEVMAFARTLRVRPVLGPEGIGKRALMAASGLHIAHWKTSETSKPSDLSGGDRYDLSDAVGRRELRRQLKQGNFIQIDTHPITGEIQTLEPAAFVQSEVNLLAASARAYRHMKQGYLVGDTTDIWAQGGICVITPSFEQWQQQWFDREGGKPADYDRHVTEAFDSLAACLGDPHMDFVINTPATEGDFSSQGKVLRGVAISGQPQIERESCREVAFMLLQEIVASGALTDRRAAS